MSPSSLALEVFDRLKREAKENGCTEKEVIQSYVAQLNQQYLEDWRNTPLQKRIVLIPQCLRRSHCPAPLKISGYICQKCSDDCVVNQIRENAHQLGYPNSFILPGGSMVETILNTYNPNAVLGISCEKEAVLGALLLQQHNITGQAILLLRDGCVNTLVDLHAVNTALNK